MVGNPHDSNFAEDVLRQIVAVAEATAPADGDPHGATLYFSAGELEAIRLYLERRQKAAPTAPQP